MAKSYVASKTIEYTGALPITINADGNALLDYRIYGESGGVGDKTENLFDIKTAVMGEYWIDDSRNTFTYHAGSKCYFIPVLANTSYTVTDFTDILPSGVFVFRAAFTNEIPTAHESNIGTTYLKKRIDSTGGSKHTATLTNVNYAYLAVQVTAAIKINNNVVISESSTAPAEYVPYGYAVPISVSDGTTSTTTPIYIGSDPLGEDEYVDYGEGKVYRHTNNIFSYAEAGIFSVGNVNVVSDGKGKFTINGTIRNNEETPKIVLSKEFTIPVSKGQGGQGVFCLRNNVYVLLKIVLYDANGIEIDTWTFTAVNRVIDTYTMMAGKTAHSIAFRGVSNATINLSTYPMVMNDGTAPSTYIPYLQPVDPPVPLPALPTCDGTTIVDYDGTPKPSQMYVEYNSWSGWEPCELKRYHNGSWEPCTEYVRRNGVWVPQT